MSIKKQVKELWKLCFNDSEAFTELYFRHRYNEEVNLVLEDKKKVVSAMQLLPYPMKLWGEVIPTAYVSGACTHPDYQGQGAMKELLTQSFTQMHKQQVPISTLIPAEPWLFNYYARMGYAPVFHYSLHNFPAEALSPQEGVEVRAHTSFQEEEYSYLAKKMAERPCCVQHTEEDYRVVLADLELAGGAVITARSNGAVTGIAFAVPEARTLHVKEVFAEDKETEAHLLYEGSKLHNSQLLSITTPCTSGSTSKIALGMARIINAPAIVSLYAAAHPGQEVSFELQDPQIPSNNGYYHLSEGACRYSSKPAGDTYQEMSINGLTQLLFAPCNPYMSLMLN